MSAAVEVSSLVHAYGSLRALDGVDLSIEAGRIFGLIGPNGAGKTTLIRTLTGFLQPSAGSVSVLGLDPRAERWALREQLGYMPQQPALYEDLTARANVAFFVAGHRRDGSRRMVDEALELVGLSDRAEHRVHTLSGGMRQRVSLACAIAHRPRMLLLDEPTAGVDPELRVAFWERFRWLADSGVTIVVSTHQMDEAFACDRIAVLAGGNLVADDDPHRLATRGRARIRLVRGDRESLHDVADYRVELPALLTAAGGVDRIEIEQETLQDVVLRIMRGEG
ncbi:MAG: ABC transporter ATP-binding protein [Acidimicrobiia bacterium]